MGRALFLPLVLVELAEVAPSSMSMGLPAAAAGSGLAAEEGPDGALGEGPLSIVAHGSRTGAVRTGAPGRGRAGNGTSCTQAAIADATLPRAATGAARGGRAEGGRSGASGRGSTKAWSTEAAARTGPA